MNHPLLPCLLRTWFLVLAVGWAGGCASNKVAGPKGPTFFPPAPDEPHVQFLLAFSSEADFGKKSSFMEHITGLPFTANPLYKPYGLAMQEGLLYVCDTARGAIEVFDFAKKRTRMFVPAYEGSTFVPFNIAIDLDGTRYVTDTGNTGSGSPKVGIYAQDDSYVDRLTLAKGMRPVDVALGPDRIYVSDMKGHCVRVYNKADRKPLFTIPRDLKAGPGWLYQPANLALDPQGRVLVSDLGGSQVCVYDLEGNYLRTLGRPGRGPGMFARPKGVAVDREGRAYVVDAATEAVQLFDRDGRLLMYFARPNPGRPKPGDLLLPAAVKVDYESLPLFEKWVAPNFKAEYLIFVTSQFGSDKVSVYAFGSKK